MLEVKITNQENFNKVSDVDFSQCSESILRNSFDGNINIQLENGKEIESTGQHGVNDWNEDFGFIVVEIENKYYVAWDDNGNTVYASINEKNKPSNDYSGAKEFKSIEGAKKYGNENVVWEFWIENSNGEII